MMIKETMFYRKLSIFLLIVLFISCKSPFVPHAHVLPVTEKEKKVVFEFDGEVVKTNNCLLTGRVINTGDAVAYKCFGAIKIYSDIKKTTEIPSQSGNWYRIDRAFWPGEKEGFETNTQGPCSCRNIKIIEIVLTYNYEDDIWGEPETQVISFIFE